MGLRDPIVQEDSSNWKIAIVTNTVDSSEVEFRSVETIKDKHGEDKVIHRTWPVRFAEESEMMINILLDIAAIEEVKALVINQAVINTNAAVARFRELRDDVFIVYCDPAEDIEETSELAELILAGNPPLMSEFIVLQAKAMGADTIVHYSYPRLMATPQFVMRRDIMQETAEKAGIKFVDLSTPDPMSDGADALQAHIAQDVPRQVRRFGKNTAFFGTSCRMQPNLITQVIETGAIFPQPCCPSPYHGFPSAFQLASQVPTGELCPERGIELMRFRTMGEIIEATRDELRARDLSGRLSNWPVPPAMAWTVIGAEYAIEWIEGNVPQERGVIDLDVIGRICMEYTLYISGEPIGGVFVPFDQEGLRISHYILGIIDYIIY